MGALSKFSIVLPLALLLAAAPLPAQEAPEPEDNGAATEAPAGETDERETPAAAASPATDDSPFDYESSEQISEDLSVSFPVDI